MILRNIYNKSMEDGSCAYLCEYVATTRSIGQDDRSKSFVLAFKNGNLASMNEAYENLQNFLGFDFSVAVVPPSRVARNYQTSCHKLAAMIIAKLGASHHIADASRVLYRTEDIPAKHLCRGRRTIYKDLATITVDDMEAYQNVCGKDILLLDDVSTSGKSLEACSQILKAAGAKSIVSFVVGKTMDDMYFANKGFIVNLSDKFSKKAADNKHTMWLGSLDNNKVWSVGLDKALLKIVANGYLRNKLTIVLPNKINLYRRKKDEVYKNIKTIRYSKNKQEDYKKYYLMAKADMQVYEKQITVVADNVEALMPAYELGMKTVLIGEEWEGADYCYRNYQEFAQSYL